MTLALETLSLETLALEAPIAMVVGVAGTIQALSLGRQVGAAMIAEECAGGAPMEMETVRHAVWADMASARRLIGGGAAAIVVLAVLLPFVGAGLRGGCIVALVASLGALLGATRQLYVLGPIQGYARDRGAIATLLDRAGAAAVLASSEEVPPKAPEQLLQLRARLLTRIMVADDLTDVAAARTRLKALAGRGMEGIVSYLRLYESSNDPPLLRALAKKVEGIDEDTLTGALARLGTVRCRSPVTPSGKVVCYDFAGRVQTFANLSYAACLFAMAAALAVPFHATYALAADRVQPAAMTLGAMGVLALVVGNAFLVRLVRNT